MESSERSGALGEVSEILPGLYVGGLASLKFLEALSITHVLSVVNFPLQKDLSRYKSLQLPLQDSEASNMLQYLPAAIKFLDAALGPGPSTDSSGDAAASSSSDGALPSSSGSGSVRVLVHCQAGVSRSPAIVAGWLMRSRGMTYEAALALVGSRRAAADPNEGFRAQLQLFGDMRCSLDPAHPVYRMWCLEELGGRWEEQGYVDPSAFAQLPEGPADLSTAAATQQTLYRCRKCRQLLATSAHVVPVEAAMGHRVFRERHRQHHRQASAQADSGAESCLFVEPIAWMAGTVTGEVSGKLYCPKCSARLGSFNWSGISNPSGAWVTPAFQLHLSKVDVVPPRPPEVLATMRRPLLGSAAPGTAPQAPSLPSGLPAAVRRLGLDERDPNTEPQLPEPDLGLEGQGKCKTRWFTHLILDLDGTLVDSEAASCESLRLAVLEVTGFDVPHAFPKDYEEVFGMDVRSCVAHYKSKFGKTEWPPEEDLAPQVLRAKEAHYKRLTDGGIRAFDGAERLIRRAFEAGMEVAIASSGAPEKIRHNLTSSGLDGLVPAHAIVSAAHVAAGKPAPDVFLAAMQATGCSDAARAIIVEDAVNGLKAARAARAFAVGITNQLPQHMLAPWADLVVDHLDCLDLTNLQPPPAAAAP